MENGIGHFDNGLNLLTWMNLILYKNMIIFHQGLNKSLSTSILVAGEMTQLLRPLAALTENLCLISSSHMVAHRQPSVTSILGAMIHSSVSCEHWTYLIEIHGDKAHAIKNKSLFNFLKIYRYIQRGSGLAQVVRYNLVMPLTNFPMVKMNKGFYKR